MRISDWSSDVCSSDLAEPPHGRLQFHTRTSRHQARRPHRRGCRSLSRAAENVRPGPVTGSRMLAERCRARRDPAGFRSGSRARAAEGAARAIVRGVHHGGGLRPQAQRGGLVARSEEHTSELQSLMSISYAVFCLKKKKIEKTNKITHS